MSISIFEPDVSIAYGGYIFRLYPLYDMPSKRSYPRSYPQKDTYIMTAEDRQEFDRRIASVLQSITIGSNMESLAASALAILTQIAIDLNRMADALENPMDMSPETKQKIKDILNRAPPL